MPLCLRCRCTCLHSHVLAVAYIPTCLRLPTFPRACGCRHCALPSRLCLRHDCTYVITVFCVPPCLCLPYHQLKNVISSNMGNAFLAESLGVQVIRKWFVFGLTFEANQAMANQKFRIFLIAKDQLSDLVEMHELPGRWPPVFLTWAWLSPFPHGDRARAHFGIGLATITISVMCDV